MAAKASTSANACGIHQAAALVANWLKSLQEYRGYRGVAVPAADWLRSLQKVRWIFSPRV